MENEKEELEKEEAPRPRGNDKQASIFNLPKGMRDLVGSEYYAFHGFLEKAAEIAGYYGFKPIETPILEREAVFTTGIGKETDLVQKEIYSLRTKSGDRLTMRPEGTAAVMRAYIERGMHTLSQPVQLFYGGPFFRHEKPQRARYRQFYQFGLEAIGSEKSIMDATIIRIVATILEEAGFKNLSVDVNSIGDKKSRVIFRRELVAYYRKHIGDICSDCKRRLRTNPLRILDCKNVKCEPLKEQAPESISSLSDEDKKHFKEVLEYLETMGVEYKINNSLVRGLDYYSRTVFEILEKAPAVNPGETPANPLALAGGGRYDYLGKQLGSRKDIPGVGAAIGVDRIIEAPEYAHLMPKSVRKPKVFFIQLGFEAKLKSLVITETLRKAHIPILQALSKDKLGVQLGTAEKLGIPYVIIIGQKEALENTVIVRNMETHSQDTIPIPDLAQHLKKIK
jgi:histidyl-tRNA synthetase